MNENVKILNVKFENKPPPIIDYKDPDEQDVCNKRKLIYDDEYKDKVTELIKKARKDGENENEEKYKDYDEEEDLFW